MLAIFAMLPLFLADYLTVFFTRVLILSLLAISFDLVWGYAGILSFGQALFYGTAAYSVALMARDLGITSIFIVLPAVAAHWTRAVVSDRLFPASRPPSAEL